jgi:cell wall-associated NlpC family hydrolase
VSVQHCFNFKVTQKLVSRFVLFTLVFTVMACGASRKAKVRARQVETVINTARMFTGTPYKYGGTTRAGMDCSGLTINAFRAINLSLPRQAEEQSQVGEKVKMNQLIPGDLVFFATGKKRREVTHVGIVTEVKSKDNIKFIHASTSLGVVETNLFSDYYLKRFRGGRRVIE